MTYYKVKGNNGFFYRTDSEVVAIKVAREYIARSKYEVTVKVTKIEEVEIVL